MIHVLITFNFHQEGQSVRQYIDRVFAAAKFLGYDAGEQQLVDRIIMNLYPTILAQAAFLERPRSRKELYNAVGLIEEKFSVLKERQRTQLGVAIPSGSELHNRAPSRNVPTNSRHHNVGIVDVWVMLNVTVVRRLPHRETGRCPAVARPPGQEL